MLKRPSVVATRPAAMEVESTRVQTLPDGKKMIDVTMRRTVSATDDDKLVLPQFDDDDSSSSDDDDDPRANAPQYELPEEPTIQREEENNNASEPNRQSEFHWSGVQDIQALTHTNVALREEVVDLKAQLKTLQIELEALAPVLGSNASAVHDILLDKDGTDHDIRDTKIVHQAKTLRHLKRSLQREKQLAVDAVKQCKAMDARATALEKENETLQLKLARFQARASASPVPLVSLEYPGSSGDSTAAQPPATKDKETVGAYKKKFEDMRIKHDKVLADLKKTQRALVREVGDDVSLDEFVENTGAGAENARRGRAQQIVMLKAKVKKLEQELKAATEPTASSSNTSSDVDERAMQDLAVQHAQKQRLIDKLTTERDEQLERNHQLTKKFDALKSRAQILEKEKHEHKSKLQVLVDKSRNDDALVDALQKQLETWKGKLQEAKRARTAECSSVASGGLPKDERLELDRLRALVADYKRQQANSNGFMPPPSEAAQYRSMTAEKERLVEQVKVLQSQLDEKDKQLRAMKSSSDLPMTSHPVPVSRIPRLGSGPLPVSQYVPTPPPTEASAQEMQKKTFRDAMASKEQEIEVLKQQLQRLTQQQQPDTAAQQEIQDLQDENEYLRQEFDRLKTRYEAVLKNARKATG